MSSDDSTSLSDYTEFVESGILQPLKEDNRLTDEESEVIMDLLSEEREPEDLKELANEISERISGEKTT